MGRVDVTVCAQPEQPLFHVALQVHRKQLIGRRFGGIQCGARRAQRELEPAAAGQRLERGGVAGAAPLQSRRGAT